MKVKSLREDFVVDEISSLPFESSQSLQSSAPSVSTQRSHLPFAVYRLRKSGIGTVEATNEVLQAWGLPRRALGYAGRKDRHAVTSQTVTLYGGRKDDYVSQKFSMEYLGQSKKQITAQDISGNQFRLALRGLDPEQLKTTQQRLGQAHCIPNYFDEQRFGSVSVGGEFPAVPWCLGDYQRAAYLLLAEDNPRDSTAERQQREIVRDHWGDWQACKDRLDRSNRRSVITYLVDHPGGFKKALALLNRDLRSMLVSALQSKLWNEVVSRWIGDLASKSSGNSASACFNLSTLGGLLRFPHSKAIQEQLNGLKIPLPSSRPTKWPKGTEPARKFLREICDEMELPVHKLRFSHPRDVFFSRAQRSVLLQVDKLKTKVVGDELADESNEGQERHEGHGRPDGIVRRQKLVLEFTLPPGQYATMLLKSLQVAQT